MPTAEAPQTRLVASGLSVGYGRSLVAEGLDLAIPHGAFTALAGPNGSGKSTVLHALAGLIPARKGSVLLDGRAISGLPAKAVARHLGVLAQAPVAPEGLSVDDLVRQGRYPHRSLFRQWSREDDEACEEAIRLTDMGTLRHRPLDQLSGGQRQRAWIAMTLAQATEILLLDEPTTFLDLAHQIEVLELLAELVKRRGKTVVAVLHDINQAARYADTMVLMKEGRIVAAGAPETVVTAELIERVFEVPCLVTRDPMTGGPHCIPSPRPRG